LPDKVLLSSDVPLSQPKQTIPNTTEDRALPQDNQLKRKRTSAITSPVFTKKTRPNETTIKSEAAQFVAAAQAIETDITITLKK
jgi:hypothetical protein